MSEKGEDMETGLPTAFTADDVAMSNPPPSYQEVRTHTHTHTHTLRALLYDCECIYIFPFVNLNYILVR